MKRLIFTLLVCALMATPALATPTLQFVSTGSGGWSYTASGAGAGTFSFTQPIVVGTVQGGSADPLAALNVGYVHIPNLTLSGGAGGPYTLTPVTSTITITLDYNPVTETFLTGTLGVGPYVVNSATSSSGYHTIAGDITGITSPSNSISSPIVDAIAAHGSADFSISLDWDQDFAALIDQSGVSPPETGSDGMSGQMTIPAPGAILLGSIGAGLVGWLRRRRML